MSKLNKAQFFSLMMILSNFRQNIIDLLKTIESVDLENYQKEISSKDGVLTIIDQLSSFIHKDKFEEGFDFAENYDRLKEILYQIKTEEFKKIENQNDKVLILNYVNKSLVNSLNDKKKELEVIFEFAEEKLYEKFNLEIRDKD